MTKEGFSGKIPVASYFQFCVFGADEYIRHIPVLRSWKRILRNVYLKISQSRGKIGCVTVSAIMLYKNDKIAETRVDVMIAE